MKEVRPKDIHFFTACVSNFFHLMNLIFLVLVLILKTKIDRRTQKSAANNAFW